MRSVGLTVLMASHLGACSLSMRTPPPQTQWGQVPFKDCDQGYGAPVADTVISGTGFGAMATSIIFGGRSGDSGSGLLFLLGTALFVPWGLSAWRGYIVRDRCERYVNQTVRGAFDQVSTP